jgi:hypothetical protein
VIYYYYKLLLIIYIIFRTYITIFQHIKRPRKYKLYIKLNKYFFNIKEVEFLGFIIGFIRVKPDSNKILTIKKWPKPKLFYKV